MVAATPPSLQRTLDRHPGHRRHRDDEDQGLRQPLPRVHLVGRSGAQEDALPQVEPVGDGAQQAQRSQLQSAHRPARLVGDHQVQPGRHRGQLQVVPAHRPRPARGAREPERGQVCGESGWGEPETGRRTGPRRQRRVPAAGHHREQASGDQRIGRRQREPIPDVAGQQLGMRGEHPADHKTRHQTPRQRAQQPPARYGQHHQRQEQVEVLLDRQAPGRGQRVGVVRPVDEVGQVSGRQQEVSAGDRRDHPQPRQ